MSRYHFRIVNVFAESTFGGNPLCVFDNATGMDDATMLALARQFNLSETTFILPSDCADARMRIFTPAAEMRFAGHPTLGTAHVVRDLMQRTGALHLECHAGVIPVSAVGDTWTLTAPTSGMPSVQPVAHDSKLIARLFGLSADDLHDAPRWVDTGSEHLLIPLNTTDAVRRATPASSLLAQWPANRAARRSAYLFAFDASDGNARKVLARYFFATPGGAIAEDPGTGSACANLGGWWIATGKHLPQHLEISQGEAVQRECRLLLDVTEARTIHVGGRVIEIGRGSVDV